MYNSLIFEGGGTLGIAYLGAIRYLSEINILFNIKKFGGTSAGSQIATLLALDYSIDEIDNIFSKIPLEKLKDGSFGFVRNIRRLLFDYGYFKGKFMKNYFEKIIENKLGKKDATFLDLYNYNQNFLRITGTCLEKKCLEIFDYKNTPNMPISIALNISCSVPYFFKPVKYNNKTYVDGGCLCNLPKNIFDDDNIIDNCIVFKLVNNNNEKLVKINNIKDYSLSLINAIYIAANKVKVYNDKITLIKIDTGDIDGLNFNLENNDKIFLKNRGYLNTMNIISEILKIEKV